MPCIETQHTHAFRIKEKDPWLKTGKRVDDFSKLPDMAIRLTRRSKRFPTRSFTGAIERGEKDLRLTPS